MRSAHSATVTWTRRDVLRWLAFAGAASLAPAVARATQRGQYPALRLRIGLLATGSAGADVARGFTLGVAEAARAAELFGAQLSSEADRSVRALAAAGCTAIVGVGSDASRLAAMQRDASDRRILFLNAAVAADSLRDPACGDLAFHVAPSDAMKVAAAGGRASVRDVVAWHERLYRFGAEQLNDRFRHRFAAGMTGAAWCGWLAVKIAWEAALRSRSATGRDMAAHLLRSGTGFDGHKGTALRFAADRQLVQPLYLLPELREVRAAASHRAHGSAPCGR